MFDEFIDELNKMDLRQLSCSTVKAVKNKFRWLGFSLCLIVVSVQGEEYQFYDYGGSNAYHGGNSEYAPDGYSPYFNSVPEKRNGIKEALPEYAPYSYSPREQATGKRSQIESPTGSWYTKPGHQYRQPLPEYPGMGGLYNPFDSLGYPLEYPLSW